MSDHYRRTGGPIANNSRSTDRVSDDNLGTTSPQINPNHVLVDINPNIQEVVPKDFVEKAYRNDAKLRDIKEALEKTIEEFSKQNFVVDDAEMTAKWKSLQYAIKNLARTYFCDLIPLEQLSHDQAARLERVSPLYQQILSTEGQVHLLFQSLIWKRITEEILWDSTIVWGERISAAFTTLLKVRWNSTEDYHAWRAQTGEIIQGGIGVHDRYERHLKMKLYSISRFIPKKKLSNEKYATIFRHSVEEIIDKAIELAVISNQSWCAYHVKVVAHGNRFDPTTMEYGEECDAPQVDLMISPALIKCGNSRGKNYNQWLVLAKSHVHSFDQHTQEGGNKEGRLIDYYKWKLRNSATEPQGSVPNEPPAPIYTQLHRRGATLAIQVRQAPAAFGTSNQAH
ncbi:hypothetical protein GGR58DRAFT_506363 [Xylaria digitata]|nr:hypothetical protein GGR58DRAFT_506363 [Xylaria digitata]